jgi:hypothetical protein
MDGACAVGLWHMGRGAGPTEVRNGPGLVSGLERMGREMSWRGRFVCLLGLIELLGRRAGDYNDCEAAVVEGMSELTLSVREVTVAPRNAVVGVAGHGQEAGSCHLDMVDSLY